MCFDGNGRILAAMHTGDSWGAWQRAGRMGVRRMLRAGMFHPTALLCTAVLLLVWGCVAGVFALWQLERTLGNQAQLSVELSPSAADQDVQAFYAAAQGVRGVVSVQLVSKEQALALERTAHPDLGDFLDRYQIQNPFTDAFQIKLRSVAGFASLQSFLHDERWSGVIDASAMTSLAEQQEALERLAHVIDLLRSVAWAGAALLAMVALFLLTDITLVRLVESGMERRTVRLLGGGWVDADGGILCEVVCTLWAALVVSGAVALGAVQALSMLDLGGDPVTAGFLDDLRSAFVSGALPFALEAAVAIPLSALLALTVARYRLPSHG